MTKVDLPFASEFSPEIVDLARVLQIIRDHEGDRLVIEGAFAEEYFAGRRCEGVDDRNIRKLAMNLYLGVRRYLLVDDNADLTDIGERLYGLRDSPDRLYEVFAGHILVNLNGLILVQAVRDIRYSGRAPDLRSISRAFTARGLYLGPTSTHASKMRLWLEKAGVFQERDWRIDERRLQALIGLSNDELDALAEMPPNQKGFLKALANIGGQGTHLSNAIQKLAAATYGTDFNEKLMAKTVLYPLRDAGYVTLRRGTAKHGAKPFEVTPTDKFRAEIVAPILAQYEQILYADLLPFLRRPFVEILEDLTHKDTQLKGLALEALAVKLMRLVDLQYLATRLRGSQTGGAEVDVIFESTRLVYTRWQVQCKNTGHVHLDDVAKEVGLTHVLKSNAIVMVSTGVIGPEARRYAHKIMQDSNLAIIMIDRDDIASIAKDPTYLVDVLNREAIHAMELKRIEE